MSYNKFVRILEGYEGRYVREWQYSVESWIIPSAYKYPGYASSRKVSLSTTYYK